MSDLPTMDLDDDGPGEESFETARPSAGHPLSASEYVIGCCLLDEGESLDRAISMGLSSVDFEDADCAEIFVALREMRSRGIPIALDTLAAELGSEPLGRIGLPALMALSDPDRIGTTAHVGHRIKTLLDQSERERLERLTARAQEAISRGAPAEEIITILERAKLPTKAKAVKPALRLPSSFNLLSSSDGTSLLGNRYLNRGDGLVISGQSGCGKSSMQTQMAEAWSLGEDFHGIKPAAPLSSLIIQSEDSDGDIAESWHSIRHVKQRTPEQTALTDSRVRIVTDRVNRGARFLASLKAHIAEFKPDLVWINPLQAFVDGDITSSQDIGAFLREGLNSLNEPATFGIVLIHHTTKPATGKDRHDRLWHEQMYDMAGGAEIINWARAIISLKPLASPGEYCLRLAKRGRRAGVTKMVEQGAGERAEPVVEIGVRHATGKLPSGIPIIYWEAMALPDKDAPKAGGGAGRPEKYPFVNYKSVFPKKIEPGKPFNQIFQACQDNGIIPKGSLQGVLNRWSEQNDIEIIRPENGPMRYRAAF